MVEVPRMISVAEHQQRCLDALRPLPPVEVELLAAHGRVLAQDVVSPLELPGFDNSAMDGYAVLVADVARATEQQPVELPVVADIPAGSTAHRRLAAGQAMRIMTGAPFPDGAQAVVPVEASDGGVQVVRLSAPAADGAHVRRAASDVRCGDVVLRAGEWLGSAAIALLAAVGRGRVLVHPAPRVVVLSTGSELVPPGVIPGYGKVVDSNSVMLMAAVVEAGACPRQVGAVADDPEVFLRRLTAELADADLVVTTGGVSAGAYDTVKEVLRELGTVWFGKVAMQPGMPQGFGVVGPDATPIFTLPGNPVSAYVSFEMFVRPALRRLAGHAVLHRPQVSAVAQESWTAPLHKVQLARAQVTTTDDGGRGVRLAGGQGSFVMQSLARADALVLVPAGVGRVEEGDEVQCLLLDRGTA